MSISFNNSKPIYLQLKDYFFQQICTGSLKLGEKLPSVRETATEVAVNPNTVQRAYAEMERYGVVESRRGQGSFVTEDEGMIKQLRTDISEQHLTKFVEFMQNIGFSRAEILEKVEVALKNSKG